MPRAEQVLDRLRGLARPGGREGMARFGINPERALGVRIPDLRRLARELGKDHSLALALWRTGVHEARILASMVDQPGCVTERLALMAWRAVHDRGAPDREFVDLLPLIERESDDPRNFVKKAMSWALRQIGKRSRSLNRHALVVAKRLAEHGESGAARWIGKDALSELTSDEVRGRLR